MDHLEHRPLRGAARGRVLKSLVAERIQKADVCILSEAVADFNARYSPPMDANNATTALRADQSVRRIAQGVYARPAGDGPVLPLVRAVYPRAWALYEILERHYPRAIPTREMHKLAQRRHGGFSRSQFYDAMTALERQGILRWDAAHSALSRMHPGRSELLGGGKPTDVAVNRAVLPPIDDSEHDGYFKKLKMRRSADGDVIDPTDGGMKIPDPFS